MSSQSFPTCAACTYEWAERFCRNAKGKAPANCPSVHMRDLAETVRQVTQGEDNLEFARQASIQEAEGYGDRESGYATVRPIKPRIVEIVELARRLGYRRLGLAFCNGLRKEAAVVEEIFKTNGFEVVSVSCKAGAAPKSNLGLTVAQQVDTTADRETMCNPIFQAEVLNAMDTDFNVIMGLCVGHDSHFFKHAKALGTVLAVKDRVLGHNPLAAIQQYDGYYRYLKKPLP
jgi:uncharacterized metal-binding protein